MGGSGSRLRANAHLSDDETVAKMGHPKWWVARSVVAAGGLVTLEAYRHGGILDQPRRISWHNSRTAQRNSAVHSGTTAGPRNATAQSIVAQQPG